MGIEPINPLKWSRKALVKLKSKSVRQNNYFVLYDVNDEVVCYFNDFNELLKYINYRLSDLVHEYNRYNTNIITITIDNKKYKLATYC